MPLSINVGLSRKASKDYQSTGASINVTAELDQALLARPQDLQQRIGELYAQAEAALERQAEGESSRPIRESRRQPARSNGNGRNGGSMTQSQRRAIEAIARRCQIDPADEARAIVGAELDELTLRQASELIDHLKSLQPTSDGR